MYNGSLVVTSGYTNSKTTQLFDAELKQWKYVAATNKLRACHALVAAEGSLFAIGGWNVKSKQSVPSVKRWADLNDNGEKCILCILKDLYLLRWFVRDSLMQLVINQRKQERLLKSMTLATKPTIRGLMSGQSMWKDIFMQLSCCKAGFSWLADTALFTKYGEQSNAMTPSSTAGKAEYECVCHAKIDL